MRSSLIGTLLLTSVALIGCPPDEPGDSSNLRPVAHAGSDQTEPASEAMVIDGRSSYDPDGDELEFHWSFDYTPTGSALAEATQPFSPNHDDSGQTTFTPDSAGVYVVKLVVRDGKLNSQPAYATLVAETTDETPTADAGPDQTGSIGTASTFDASESINPHQGALNFSWYLAGAPQDSALTSEDLTDMTSVATSLTPDTPGTYTLSLTVSSTFAVSATDSVDLVVTGDNQQPTAIVAESEIISVDCTEQVLDCSASTDPEGSELSYYWELQEVPESSTATSDNFSDPSAASTNFWPDVSGSYMATCSVFDGQSWSYPESIVLELDERTTNSTPQVNAGADRLENAGYAECVADGFGYDCDSCSALVTTLGPDASVLDADGDELELTWTLLDGAASLVTDDALSVEVILGETMPEQPGSCTETEFKFELNATDCPGATDSDQVTIAVKCCGSSVE